MMKRMLASMSEAESDSVITEDFPNLKSFPSSSSSWSSSSQFSSQAPSVIAATTTTGLQTTTITTTTTAHAPSNQNQQLHNNERPIFEQQLNLYRQQQTLHRQQVNEFLKEQCSFIAAAKTATNNNNNSYEQQNSHTQATTTIANNNNNHQDDNNHNSRSKKTKQAFPSIFNCNNSDMDLNDGIFNDDEGYDENDGGRNDKTGSFISASSTNQLLYSEHVFSFDGQDDNMIASASDCKLKMHYWQMRRRHHKTVNGIVFLLNSFVENANSLCVLGKRLVEDNFIVVGLQVDYHEPELCLVSPTDPVEQQTRVELCFRVWQFLYHVMNSHLQHWTQTRLFLGGSGLGASLALEMILRQSEAARWLGMESHLCSTNGANNLISISGLMLFNTWLLHNPSLHHYHHHLLSNEPVVSAIIHQEFANGNFSEYSTLPFAQQNQQLYFEQCVRHQLKLSNFLQQLVQHSTRLHSLLNSQSITNTNFQLPLFLGHSRKDTITSFDQVRTMFNKNHSHLKCIKFYSDCKHAILQDHCIIDVLEDSSGWLLDTVQEMNDQLTNNNNHMDIDGL